MEVKQKKKRISPWLIGCGGVGLLFGGVVTWLVLQIFDYPLVAPRIEETVKEYKAAGLPWLASELVEPVPASENAAIEIQEAVKLALMRPQGKASDDLYELWKKGDFKKIENELTSLQPMLEKFVSASKKPKLNYYRDWDKGSDVLFPEFAQLKFASKVLVIRAMMSARAGDVDSALDDLETINRLSVLSVQEPLRYSMLVSISLNSIGQDGYLRVAEVNGDNKTLHKLIESLSQYNESFDFEFTIRGDIYVAVATARNLRADQIGKLNYMEKTFKIDYKKRDGVPDGMIMQANFVRLLEGYINIPKAIKEHPGDLTTALKRVDEIEEHAYTQPLKASMHLRAIFFPTVAGAGRAIQQVKTRKEMTLAMLKSLEFRNDHKRFPKDLNEIGVKYTDEVSGKDIVSLDSEGVFQIYAFGINGVDDGGRLPSTSRTDDLAIHFPVTIKK